MFLCLRQFPDDMGSEFKYHLKSLTLSFGIPYIEWQEIPGDRGTNLNGIWSRCQIHLKIICHALWRVQCETETSVHPRKMQYHLKSLPLSFEIPCQLQSQFLYAFMSKFKTHYFTLSFTGHVTLLLWFNNSHVSERYTRLLNWLRLTQYTNY